MVWIGLIRSPINTGLIQQHQHQGIRRPGGFCQQDHQEMLANIQSVTQTLIQNTNNVKELIGSSEVGRRGLQEVVEDIKEIAKESEGLLEINEVGKHSQPNQPAFDERRH